MIYRLPKFNNIRKKIKSTTPQVSRIPIERRISNQKKPNKRLTIIEKSEKNLSPRKKSNSLVKEREITSRPVSIIESIKKPKINYINNLDNLISQKKQLIFNHIQVIWNEYNKKRVTNKRISTTIINEALKAEELLKKVNPIELRLTSKYDIEINKLEKEISEYEKKPELIKFQIIKEKAKIKEIDEDIKKVNIQKVINEKDALERELSALRKLNHEQNIIYSEFIDKQLTWTEKKEKINNKLKEKWISIYNEYQLNSPVLKSIVDYFDTNYPKSFNREIIEIMRYKHQRVDELNDISLYKNKDIEFLIQKKEDIEKKIKYLEEHLPTFQTISKKRELKKRLDVLEGLRRQNINEAKLEKTNEYIYTQKLSQARRLAKIENRLYKLVNYIKQ